MIQNKVFLLHFICYWSLVIIYDKNVPKKVFYKSVMLSLKNQLLYTYPSICISIQTAPVISMDKKL